MFSNLAAFALRACFATSSLSTLLSATPIDTEVGKLIPRANEFPPPQQIVNSYFRRNMTADGRPGVFYNVAPEQLSRDQIRAIAAGLNGITLYDSYRPDDDDNAPFVPSRGPYYYYYQQGELRDWFRYTSRVFAQNLRNNVAYLIWDKQQPWQNNPATYPQFWTAIWSTDEFNAIIRGQTQIDTVYVVDPSTGLAGDEPYWVRGDPVPDQWNITMAGANSESDDTANPNPNGPPSGEKKRDVGPAAKRSTLTEADWERILSPELNRRNPSEEHLAKRSPLINGIEQAPDQSVFTYGNGDPWVPGLCNFPFTQAYQDGDSGNFIDVTLFDDSQTNVLGNITDQRIEQGDSIAMTSRLPYTLVIIPGDNHDDDITLKYSGETWYSGSEESEFGGGCTTGDYQNNNDYYTRQGDCTFNCNQFQ